MSTLFILASFIFFSTLLSNLHTQTSTASISPLSSAIAAEPAETKVTDIEAPELIDRIANQTAPFILDVRSKEEYQEGHIEGAVNIPFRELKDRLGELPIKKIDEVVVYCHSGPRAYIAQATLKNSGYRFIRNLSGHWSSWPKP